MEWGNVLGTYRDRTLEVDLVDLKDRLINPPENGEYRAHCDGEGEGDRGVKGVGEVQPGRGQAGGADGDVHYCLEVGEERGEGVEDNLAEAVCGEPSVVDNH